MARGRKNMEEQAKYQTKMDAVMTEVYDTPTTVAEQKILNARLRLALRTGNLPFQFIDSQEKDYRKIVYAIGVEVPKKFSGQQGWWQVDYNGGR